MELNIFRRPKQSSGQGHRRLSSFLHRHSTSYCIKTRPRQPDMDDHTITPPLEPLRTVNSSNSNYQPSRRHLQFTPDNNNNNDCVSRRNNNNDRTFVATDAIENRPSPSYPAAASSSSSQGNDPAEDESIALARMLMAQEAMDSYAMSAEYLRHNQAEYSQEDMAALQAAIDEEEDDDDDDIEDFDFDEDDTNNDQYEMMLRLGEAMGDVKQERWTMEAQSHIASLETHKFVGKAIPKNIDQNDTKCKCLICQFNYEENELLRKLPCGHCFHANCIDQWLSQKDYCPYCRQPIV